MQYLISLLTTPQLDISHFVLYWIILFWIGTSLWLIRRRFGFRRFAESSAGILGIVVVLFAIAYYQHHREQLRTFKAALTDSVPYNVEAMYIESTMSPMASLERCMSQNKVVYHVVASTGFEWGEHFYDAGGALRESFRGEDVCHAGQQCNPSTPIDNCETIRKNRRAVQ